MEENITEMKTFNTWFKRISKGLTYLWVTLAYPTVVFADVLEDKLQQLSDSDTEVDLITNLYEFAIPVSVIGLVALSVYAGILMVTSAGDPEKLSEAKETITNAVLGFAVVVLSVALLALLTTTLNIDLGSF